ncbi:Sec1-like protein [Umbelopsis sp. PMI_123]|nr:Sec1-like protein [Umbelopsis sp. PMI_123]
MPELTELLRKRLMDTIRAIQPPEKWKLMVIDSQSIKVLTAVCNKYDILEENVTVIENIERPRQPYPTLEAIYFLTPCKESVYRLIDDFTAKGPMYKGAHVHFTSSLDDDLFGEFNRRLKSRNASQYILRLKEMYVDFMAVESSVFTFDRPISFFNLFGSEERSQFEPELDKLAKQIVSICATLGEDPIIRYHRPLDEETGTPMNKSLPYKLAMTVQREIDNFCRINPNFPPPRQPPQPRATLVIVDRSIDHASPLLHEFTYQAMITDLLPVEPAGTALKYNYEYGQTDGTTGSKEVILDENDTIYTSVRHLHIAETTDKLIENFNKFLQENKAALSASEGSSMPPKDSARSLRDMKEMLTNLPQFQDLKAKYSAHLSIAQECMSVFEKQKLNSVGNLEQSMATGETPTGDMPKTIVLDMVPLLDDPYVSPLDKARLLMLYIISKEGGIFDEDRKKLLEHARLPRDLREAINNLTILGVKVTRVQRKAGEKSLRKRRERRKSSKDQEMPYELSRYVNTVKKVMEANITGTMDAGQFPYTRQSDADVHDDGLKSGSTVPSTGVSLRTTKPTWSKKTNSMGGTPRNPTGAKLIIFVAGGMTYSEMRSAYEMADIHNRDVIIGSSHIITPAGYIQDLSKLRKPAPIPHRVIPPYTPPAPPAQESSRSLRPHIPQMPRSQSPSHLPSIASSKSSENPLETDKSEKQKKKKGLGRLFG